MRRKLRLQSSIFSSVFSLNLDSIAQNFAHENALTKFQINFNRWWMEIDESFRKISFLSGTLDFKKLFSIILQYIWPRLVKSLAYIYGTFLDNELFQLFSIDTISVHRRTDKLMNSVEYQFSLSIVNDWWSWAIIFQIAAISWKFSQMVIMGKVLE